MHELLCHQMSSGVGINSTSLNVGNYDLCGGTSQLE